jgi:hypothetical protein
MAGENEGDKGKGDLSKGKDKGSYKGKPIDGKGKEGGKGDSLGKGSSPPAAASLQQDWHPACWTCGSLLHVRANCTATSAAEGLDPPPAGSCLECGVPGHNRWQCPILLSRPDGSSVILRCARHAKLRSAYNLIWCPALCDWRCALYTPCQVRAL